VYPKALVEETLRQMLVDGEKAGRVRFKTSDATVLAKTASMKPVVCVQDSEESGLKMGIVKYLIPLATPQQVLYESYANPTIEQQKAIGWTLLAETLEEISPYHRVVHG
jgi:hypothetical protein